MSQKRKPGYCPTCDRTFTTSFSLILHNKNVHMGIKKFSCGFCPFRTANHWNLTKHIATHTKEKPYKCPHENCSYDSNCSFQVKIHVQRHHPEPNAPGQPEEIRKPHKCPLCPFRTAVALRLEEHIRRHTGERPYPCPEPNCGATFNCKSNLRGHLRVHQPDEVSRKFPCPIAGCPVRLKWPRDVKKHLMVHQTERLLTCPIPGCGRQYKGPVNISQHLKTHSEDKPFMCTFKDCGNRTKYATHLKIHVRVHTEEKPCKCPIEGCGHSSRNSSNLAQHMATHRSEKPLKCPVCNRGFDFQSRLLKHCRRVGHSESTNSTENVSAETKPNADTKSENVGKKINKRITKNADSQGKSPKIGGPNSRRVIEKKIRASINVKEDVDQSTGENDGLNESKLHACKKCGFFSVLGKNLASHYLDFHNLPVVRLYKLGLNLESLKTNR